MDYDDFYRENHPRLVRALAALTGRSGVAEELAQEALIAAHRRWADVSHYDRPDLWVRQVAIRRAISAHRRAVAEVAAIARLSPPTTQVVTPEVDDELWAAVRRLPRRQAVAVVLTAVEGMTSAELAVVLRCSPETARTHARRGREGLRRALGGATDD